MVQKITRAFIAIAICWLLAYGMGSAATHCCSGTAINTLGPSGVKSHLNPTLIAHCQPMPARYMDAKRCADRSDWPALKDFNAPGTCCSATSCTPVGMTAHPGQLPSSAAWFQDKDNSCTGACNHDRLAHFNHIDADYGQTVPIFLRIKSILC